MSHVLPEAPRRSRVTWFAVATGLVSAGLLALSMSGTLSGFVASIADSGNTSTTGTLVMQETGPGTGGTTATCSSTDGGSVATNTATCTSIDEFGGTGMVPGDTLTSAVTIKNAGSATAKTFTLTPGTCSAGTSGPMNGGATDICSKLTVVVTNTTAGTQVFSGTLAALGSNSAVSLPAVPGGGSTAFSFAVTFPSSLGNTYQGLTATVPLTWAFAS